MEIRQFQNNCRTNNCHLWSLKEFLINNRSNSSAKSTGEINGPISKSMMNSLFKYKKKTFPTISSSYIRVGAVELGQSRRFEEPLPLCEWRSSTLAGTGGAAGQRLRADRQLPGCIGCVCQRERERAEGGGGSSSNVGFSSSFLIKYISCILCQLFFFFPSSPELRNRS